MRGGEMCIFSSSRYLRPYFLSPQDLKQSTSHWNCHAHPPPGFPYGTACFFTKSLWCLFAESTHLARDTGSRRVGPRRHFNCFRCAAVPFTHLTVERESELDSREMNPPCARCKKTVYPVEKLTCLDKVMDPLYGTSGPCMCIKIILRLGVVGWGWRTASYRDFYLGHP